MPKKIEITVNPKDIRFLKIRVPMQFNDFSFSLSSYSRASLDAAKITNQVYGELLALVPSSNGVVFSREDSSITIRDLSLALKTINALQETDYYIELKQLRDGSSWSSSFDIYSGDGFFDKYAKFISSQKKITRGHGFFPGGYIVDPADGIELDSHAHTIFDRLRLHHAFNTICKRVAQAHSKYQEDVKHSWFPSNPTRLHAMCNLNSLITELRKIEGGDIYLASRRFSAVKHAVDILQRQIAANHKKSAWPLFSSKTARLSDLYLGVLKDIDYASELRRLPAADKVDAKTFLRENGLDKLCTIKEAVTVTSPTAAASGGGAATSGAASAASEAALRSVFG